MKYYLIDYENVNAAGLKGMDEITSDSRVVLFYTKNSSKIDLGVFNLLRNTAAELAVIEVHHGKQALDIQLASYVGFLIGTEPADTEYYIVSKDKGYRNIQDFWSDRRIVLCTSLQEDSEIVDEPKPAKSGSRSSSRGGRSRSSAKAGKAEEKSEKNEKTAEAGEKAARTEPAQQEHHERTSGHRGIQTKAEKNTRRERHEKVDLTDAAHPSQNAKAEAPAKEADAAVTTAGANDAKAGEPDAKAPVVNAFAEAAALAAAMAAEKAAKAEAADKPEKAEKPKKVKKSEKAKTEKAEKPAKAEKAAKAETPETKARKKAAPKAKKTDEPKPSEVRNEVNTEIQKILSKEGFSGDVINATASFVSKNIGKDGYKQLIYRGIIKGHGQKQGLAIYRLIKGVL